MKMHFLQKESWEKESREKESQGSKLLSWEYTTGWGPEDHKVVLTTSSFAVTTRLLFSCVHNSAFTSIASEQK